MRRRDILDSIDREADDQAHSGDVIHREHEIVPERFSPKNYRLLCILWCVCFWFMNFIDYKMTTTDDLHVWGAYGSMPAGTGWVITAFLLSVIITASLPVYFIITLKLNRIFFKTNH